MAGPPVKVQIDLLGGFVVRVGGSVVPEEAWRRRHAAALVKLLALAPRRSLHREQVVDRLWPDVTLSEVAPRLHKAAHFARSALGLPDAVLLRGDTVSLLPHGDVDIDVVQFEEAARAALEAGSVEAADGALARYAGPLLPQDPYEDWASAHRDRLRELWLRLVRQAGRWSEVLAEDPLDEVAHLELLKGLVKSGQRAAALRHYESMARTYRSELGVEPPAAHQRLHRGLLAQPDVGGDDPPARAPRRGGRMLAAPRGRLVGRDRDLTALERRLQEHRLVTITGPGGAGKSTLAGAVARRRLERGDPDIVLAELAPSQDAEGMVRAVAEAAGIEGRAAGGVAELAAALAGRRVLLVLDNCEHLLAASADLVDAVLEAGPAVRVLATSREPLGVEGEAVWRLGSLGAEAVELFLDRARAATGQDLLRADDPSVLAVCEHLDGLPLALELAAAQLPYLTVTELEARLDDRLRLLVGSRPRAGARHTTLAATIAWSHQLLSDREQQAFDRLGVFRADFDLDAAAAVLGTTDSTAAALLVRSLVTKSLLVHDAETGRYRYLETIRLFARERLAERGLLDATTERLRAHVLARARALPRPRRWLSATAAAASRVDIENVRTAFRAGLAHGDATGAVDVALGLSTLWRNAVWFSEGLDWVAELSTLELEPADRLWVALLRADLAVGAGQQQALGEAAAEARQWAEVIDDQAGLVIARLYQALVARDRVRAAADLAELGATAAALGEPELSRLARAFRVVALLIAGREHDGEEEVSALTEGPGLGREYDRYICLWMAWVRCLVARDGAGMRRWMDVQLENVQASGLQENWLTTYSRALTAIGEGRDHLGLLAAARRRAEAEGRAAEADVVLALAYAAACADETERAAELVGACQGELFHDTASNVTMILIRDKVVRPRLPESDYASAIARGRQLSLGDILAEHGLGPGRPAEAG